MSRSLAVSTSFSVLILALVTITASAVLANQILGMEPNNDFDPERPDIKQSAPLADSNDYCNCVYVEQTDKKEVQVSINKSINDDIIIEDKNSKLGEYPSSITPMYNKTYENVTKEITISIGENYTEKFPLNDNKGHGDEDDLNDPDNPGKEDPPHDNHPGKDDNNKDDNKNDNKNDNNKGHGDEDDLNDPDNPGKEDPPHNTHPGKNK